jgi:uncharacterized protein involved in exopolysaccharide biosynthesis
MPDSFDAYEFAGYLRSRWRFFAVACLVAVGGSAIISALLTKQYTAWTRLVIEPPVGSDPRNSMAVSPVYLDSLRTYEHFASSDSVFQEALQHFKIRDLHPGKSIESWKRAVLNVEIPRNTKILEISATLPDARKAHALALFLAEQTVALNRSVTREGDAELISDLARQVDGAKARFDDVQSAWNRIASQKSAQAMAADIEAEQAQQARIQEELLPAEITIAEDSDREKLLGTGKGAGSDGELATVRSELRFARVRAAALRKQWADLDRSITRRQAALAARTVERDQAGARLESARESYASLEGRLRDVRATVGYRGERLKIIDPGIVPERPSYPNLPLNILAALVLALIGSLTYVTLQFGYAKRWDRPLRTQLRVAGKGHDG